MQEVYGVSRQTLHHDMDLAEALDRIAEQAGQDIRPLLLARDSRWSRRAVLALDQRPAAQQKRVLAEYRVTGQVPRGRGGRQTRTMTVPRQPVALARVLDERWELARLEKLVRALRRRLGRRRRQAAAAPT